MSMLEDLADSYLNQNNLKLLNLKLYACLMYNITIKLFSIFYKNVTNFIKLLNSYISDFNENFKLSTFIDNLLIKSVIMWCMFMFTFICLLL